MKKITVMLAAVLLSAGWTQSYAQKDPRTLKILEAVLESSSGEISSTTASAPEEPTRAKSMTRTERQEGEAKPQRQPRQQPPVDPSALPQDPSMETRPAESVRRRPQPSIDTVYLSTLYTTHVIFNTDISYADLSNQRDIAGKVVDQAKNKLALKARNPFQSTASVSVEEASGVFHTYILKYAEHPRFLIIDTREGADMWALAQLDTIHLSTLYTTHVIFASDVIYADISQPGMVAGKLVDQGKNKLAAKAREPFATTASLSVEEANGVFHTYILDYMEHPAALVKDTREENKPVLGSLAGETTRGLTSGSYVRNSASKSLRENEYGGVSANDLKRVDAPTLAEVIRRKQGLYHLSVKKYDVRLTCENIYSYSDVIYMTLRLDNGSGISYETADATFVVESNNGVKRKIVYEQNIFPKNRFGSLTAAAHGDARICYSFDKLALSSDQVLKVYLYEAGGQRNLALSISYKDINGAVSPKE